MRLLVTSYFLRAVGGTESSLRAVLPLLRSRFERVGLLTMDGGTDASDGVDLTDIDWLSGIEGSSERTLETAAKWKPDVVYNHGMFDPVVDDELALRFPTAYYSHNYGGNCISGTKCHSFPSPVPCDRTLGPSCLALYFPRRCGGLNPLTTLAMYGRERRRQRMLRRCRAVLVASRHMHAEVIRNGVSLERVHLASPFPTAVSPMTDSPERRLQTGRVLMMGRITALKGWAKLLDSLPVAAAKLGRHLELVVTGDGPDKAVFEAESKRRNIPASFLGWVSLERRNAEMASADLVVVPSVWPEPFGLVGIEAGCFGVPAVGFAVGGIPDWLIPGVSGELAPLPKNSDPTPLADALVRALADEDHWQRLRVGAWKKAHQFSSKTHLDVLTPILQAVAQ